MERVCSTHVLLFDLNLNSVLQIKNKYTEVIIQRGLRCAEKAGEFLDFEMHFFEFETRIDIKGLGRKK